MSAVIWGPCQRLADLCSAKGMMIEFRDDPDGNVNFPDWRQAVFGGRPATWIVFEKRLYLNLAGLAQYEPYRGDVHELGHAVWSLLLTTPERWGYKAEVGYFRLWAADKMADRLLNEYSATKPEEGWAEDFTAFWSDCSSWPRACRTDLSYRSIVRYRFVRRIMQRLGAPIHQTL